MYNGNEWLSPNVVDTNRVSNLWGICRNSPSLSLVCRKLLCIVAFFISRQYARQCQKCLLRTENLGVHLLCCCPRTNYEHLWTSVINCMGYREYGKWIHKSTSDQCKVILGLAVSNNGVALDNMSLSFLLCKLMQLHLCIVVIDNYRMVLMYHDCIASCNNCLIYMYIYVLRLV